MIGQHPIAPPPELVQQWIKEFSQPNSPRWQEYEQDIAARAAQWGADQQLAEDAEWLDQHALDAPHLKITPMGKSLKEAMRPKAPSLKEQALALLDPSNTYGSMTQEDEYRISVAKAEIIRRALEQLDD